MKEISVITDGNIEELYSAAEDLGRLLSKTLGKDLSEPTKIAEYVSHQMMNRRSSRQVLRWIRAKSRLRRQTFDKEVIELLERENVSESQIKAVEQCYEHYSDVWDQVKKQYRKSPRAESTTENLGYPPSAIAQYLRRLHDDRLVHRSRREPLTIPARVCQWRRAGQSAVTYSKDTLTEVQSILSERWSGPVRVCLEGRRGSARAWTCVELAATLAEQYSPADGCPAAIPVPIITNWNQWELELQRSKPWDIQDDSECLEALAESIFTAADLPLDGKSALKALSSSSVVLILYNLDFRRGRIDESFVEKLLTFFSTTARLLISGDGVSEIIQKSKSLDKDRWWITHQIRVLPLNVLQTAILCRRRLLDARPDRSFFGTLGESVSCLTSAGVAGRTLARIGSGYLTPAALQSDCVLLASLYTIDFLEEADVSPEFLIPDGPDNEELDHRLCFDRLGDEEHIFLKAIENNMRRETRSRLDLTVENGDWIHSGFDPALRFLHAFVSRKLRSEDTATKDFLVDGTVIQVSSLLEDIDDHAMFVLANRGIIPNWATQDVLHARSLIKSISKILHQQEDACIIWLELEPIWDAFKSALAILRSVFSRKDARESDIQLFKSTIDALRLQFEPSRESIAGQGNLRFYGARAAAVLLGGEGLLEHVQDCLKSGLERETVAWHLTFLSEIAITVCKINQDVLESLGEAFRSGFQKLLPDSLDDDTPTTRHARYHLITAIDRLSEPSALRRFYTRFLGGAPHRWQITDKWRARAIEHATVIGGLHRLGIVGGTNPASIALQLAEHAHQEANDQTFWKDYLMKNGNLIPAQIRNHVFIAYQALAPMMLRYQREELLKRLPQYFEGTIEDSVKETASMRYCLYWLRDEVWQGVSPGQEAIQLLKRIRFVLKDRIRMEHADTEREASADGRRTCRQSPDERNLLLLEAILLDIGESLQDSGI